MKRIFRNCVSAALGFALGFLATPAAAESIGPQWLQPGGTGTDVFITYSYSNLLDGSFLLISPAELRAATEEALRLWAQFAPLHFIEQADSGPPPVASGHPPDEQYDAAGHPLIRIGEHSMPEIAHAFYPGESGLAGDVHVDASLPWTLAAGRWNFLEAVTHELGHALGLVHESDRPAIMNPFYPQQRFNGLGSAFLFTADIESIQAIYGVGRGSLQPLPAVPEPASVMLVASGLAVLARAWRRQPKPGEPS